DAGKGGRNAYGAAGVRTNAAIAKACCNCRCGTAAGASGDAREVPGISHRTVVRIVGRHAVSELVHVGLAEEHCTGIFELGDDAGVVRGYEIFQNLRSEEHTSELQSRVDLVCRLLLEKK